MPARHAALLAAAVLAGAAGCSYNPAVFPYLLPPGAIEQTHAKPRAFGYFRNYDPKSVRLGITPSGTANAPPGAQIVLVATVYDKDGLPRRDRRVEWMIDGPGNIVEADESGLFAGRGYKVDNKYAVTFTSYVPKTFTRGNDDPKGDVPIEPGQTFVVVSSAVPGETVVTAWAPEVFNRDNGLVVTKVLWGDSRFAFPAPTTARVGGEVTLSTGVNPNASDGRGNFRVRYRVIDGPATVLVPAGAGAGGTGPAGTGGKEVEAATDARGAAAVRLVQRDAKPGKTHLVIEVLKPADDGTGAVAVVGRRETSVEWAVAELKLTVAAPPVAAARDTFPVTVALDNAAGAESKDARVRVVLSNGAALAKSEPVPTRVDATGGLIFDLPPVTGKGKQAIALQVRPAGVGDVVVTAEATTADGMQANTRGVTRVDNGKLTLLLEGPPVALAGDTIPVRVSVTNGGATPAENVTVWAQFDRGLLPNAGTGPIEFAGGTLAPGQTKTFDLPLAATTAGRYGLRGTATGDGGLSAAADPIAVDVRRGELAVAVAGPQLVYLNQQATWSVAVANRGDSAVGNVVVRATVPPELKVTTADEGTIGAGTVEWRLGALRTGEQKAFTLSGDATALAPQAGITVVAVGEVAATGSTAATPVTGKGTAAVAVIGSPALSLELATPPGVVEVGKRVSYQIRVKNQGTISARKVEVTALAPPELKPVRGSGGPSDARIDATGRITFPAVEELRPGQTLTLTVDVDAATPGDARFIAQVKAAHLKTTLKEEQSTRVTGK
jgi:uncharacterized repeat protein (TIGR01451 family)